jgi:integrase
VRCADGAGSNWQKVLAGCADDYETADSDGVHVATFHQAADQARALARGKDGATDNTRPITVAEALDAFERDLVARDGLAANARRVRRHLSPTLASKPISLTTNRDYRAFRDGMLTKGLKPASAVRHCKSLAAALTLAASLDPRIANRAAWREGLGGLADSHVARKVKLSDADVRALLTAAYEIDHALGLLCETLAVTGARPVQLERAVVADLQDDRPDPRIMMPSSRKGRRRKRIERKPVAITPGLAAKLRKVARGRSATDDPLLLQSSGAPWNATDRRLAFAAAVARAGLKGLTPYSLRHASIIRQLLANVPTRVVAACHDTSVAMLERSYSAFIADVSDTVTRRALIDTSPGATADKIVPLSRGGR